MLECIHHDDRRVRSHRGNRFVEWKHTFSSVKAVLRPQITESKNSQNQINKLHHFTFHTIIKVILIIFQIKV